MIRIIRPSEPEPEAPSQEEVNYELIPLEGTPTQAPVWKVYAAGAALLLFLGLLGGLAWMVLKTAPEAIRHLPTVQKEGGHAYGAIRLGQGASVAVSGDEIWAASTDSNRVVKIDSTTRKIVASVTVSRPNGIGINRFGIWVAGPDGLIRIDPRKKEVSRVYKSNVELDFLAVNRRTVWALAATEGVLVQVEKRRPRARRLNVEVDAVGMSANRTGLWIAHVYADQATPPLLTRIDLKGRTRRFEVLERPLKALAATDDKIWIAQETPPALLPLTAKGRLQEPLPSSSSVRQLIVSDGGLWSLGSSGQQTALEAHDPATGEQLERYPVPGAPHEVGIGNETAWLADGGSIVPYKFCSPEDPCRYVRSRE